MGLTQDYQKEVDEGKRNPYDLEAAKMIDRDKGSWEQRLRQSGGSMYSDSDLEDVVRWASRGENIGKDPEDGIKAVEQKYRERGANSKGTDDNVPGQPSGTQGPPPTTVNSNGWTNQPAQQQAAPYDNSGLQQAISAQTQMMQQIAADNARRTQEMEARLASERAAEQARRDDLYGQLYNRAQQSTDVNASDPIIRGQVDNFRAEQERAQRDYLSDIAESSGPYANLRGEKRISAEKTGQAVGGFQATLLQRELESRRNEIQGALSGMAGILSGEQSAALQREMGMLNNAIQQQGLAADTMGLGVQHSLGMRAGDIDIMRAMMGNDQFYAGLGSENDRFAAQLGMNAEDRARYWDWMERQGGI